jgi:hypothetical protein
MKLDRLVFLGLVTSLSAVACTAASEDEAGRASGASSDNGSPAFACTTPGSAQAKTPDTFVDQCLVLATKAEKEGDHHFQSVCGQCLTYATRLRSNVAKSAMKCIADNVKPSSADMRTQLYGCGAATLASSCAPEAASAVGRKCTSLVATLKGGGRDWLATTDGKKDDASLEAECRAFLSGADDDAAAELEACATKDGFPLYSCLEGMDAQPVKTCIDPTPVVNVSRGAAEVCPQIGQYSDGNESMENAQSCYAIADALRSVPANTFLDSLNALVESKTATSDIRYNDVTGAAVWASRQVCQTDKAVETCKGLVEVLTERGASNTGGRLTKECRQVMSALDADAVDKAVSHIKRTPEFGKGRSLYKAFDIFDR